MDNENSLNDEDFTEQNETDADSLDENHTERVAVATRKLTADERERRFFDALDKALEKHSRQENVRQKRPQTRSERFTTVVVNRGVGILSLALILIFLGVVMIVTLFSAEPDYYLPLKLSPIAAILVGIEMLFSQMITRGRFKINIPAIIVLSVLTVGCCAAGVALNSKFREDTVEYSSRTIAAEIYDRTYKELRNSADIKSVEAVVDLNPEGAAVVEGIDALSAGDRVVINVVFGGGYTNPKDFAADCKKIIDGYRIMGIDVTDYHFYNESAFNEFSLDVVGKYVQDYSETRLAEMVNCIYIEDYSYLEDLPDLIDDIEEEENSYQEAGI